MGTTLLDEHIDVIKNYKKVYIALDKDATSKAYIMMKKLRNYVPTKLIVLNKDLKDMERGKEMSSSGVISIDKQVLGFCLNVDFFNKVKNKIDRTMFDNELKDIFDTIVYSHTKYERSLSVAELSTIFNDRNPAMPDSSRKSCTRDS